MQPDNLIECDYGPATTRSSRPTRAYRAPSYACTLSASSSDVFVRPFRIRMCVQMRGRPEPQHKSMRCRWWLWTGAAVIWKIVKLTPFCHYICDMRAWLCIDRHWHERTLATLKRPDPSTPVAACVIYHTHTRQCNVITQQIDRIGIYRKYDRYAKGMWI